MDREPTGEPRPVPEAAPAEPAREHPRPRIDVSPALHEAGHEVADLGFEGVPDSGPVLRTHEDPARPDDPLDFVNVQIPSD